MLATPVVLGFDFWNSALAADNSTLGRAIVLNGIDFTVIGVPASFTGTDILMRRLSTY